MVRWLSYFFFFSFIPIASSFRRTIKYRVTRLTAGKILIYFVRKFSANDAYWLTVSRSCIFDRAPTRNRFDEIFHAGCYICNCHWTIRVFRNKLKAVRRGVIEKRGTATFARTIPKDFNLNLHASDCLCSRGKDPGRGWILKSPRACSRNFCAFPTVSFPILENRS